MMKLTFKNVFKIKYSSCYRELVNHTFFNMWIIYAISGWMKIVFQYSIFPWNQKGLEKDRRGKETYAMYSMSWSMAASH